MSVRREAETIMLRLYVKRGSPIRYLSIDHDHPPRDTLIAAGSANSSTRRAAEISSPME
jgi:hypothetical protein